MISETFEEKQNILVISLNAPYDGVGHAGGKICNYYVKKLLSLGHNITIVAGAEEYEKQKVLADKDRYKYDLYVYYRKPLSKVERVFNIVKRLFLPTFAYGFVPKLYRKFVLNVIKQLHNSSTKCLSVDRIICDWTESAALVKQIRNIFPKTHITAIEQDVTQQAYYRLFLNEKKLLKKIIRYIIYRNTKTFENKILNLCDTVKVLNKKDKTLLENDVPKSKLCQIAPYYDRLKVKTDYLPTDKSIIFYGAMNRKENCDAVIWFIENVFNQINDDTYKFYIIGNKPDAVLEKYKSENIIITGFVEDPSVYTNDALCCVVPLLQGAGIKIKVLEAFAIGVPVLTNDIGIEGIADDSKNGRVYLHCNSSEDYIKNIKLLDSNKQFAESLGKASIQYVFSEFNYDEGSY